MTRTTASYVGLRPASRRASSAARGASKKRDTRCEVLLRRAVFRLGLRYALSASDLPGKPDLVFRRARVAVFCDGDFWHGKDLETRLARLANGHNAPYWVAKIQTNVARDHKQTAALEAAGWIVLRFWESEIRRAPETIATAIETTVRLRRDAEQAS
jgi:DNA mismatch endonuclease, patch repair protein